MIGQILKKWQPFFEFEDDRHLEFLKLCISDVIDKLQNNVAILALNLMMIGRHLEKYTYR